MKLGTISIPVMVVVVWMALLLQIQDATSLMAPQKKLLSRPFCVCAAPTTTTSSSTGTRTETTTTTLYYDYSRSQFDLYSASTWRGDTLTKYSTRYQSEPLRINCCLLTTLTAVLGPVLAPDVIGTNLSSLQTLACGTIALLSSLLGYDQLQKRTDKLTRLEKELTALELTVQLPSASVLADRPYQNRQPLSLKSVLMRQSSRILVLYGPSNTLHTVYTQQLQPLQRRWKQSRTLLVLVPSNDSTTLPFDTVSIVASSCLARPDHLAAWQDYCASLHPSKRNDTNSDDDTFLWFGMDRTGRSFASGTFVPNWLELLGRHLQPVDILSDVKHQTKMDADLAAAQAQFYHALKSGNETAMRHLWCDIEDTDISKIMQQGGRLVDWSACLKQDARPANLVVTDSDSCTISPTNAQTTGLECLDDNRQQTLLALQEWVRSEQSQSWKLFRHQTIPWVVDVAAGGTLLCDTRGCVSLVQQQSTP